MEARKAGGQRESGFQAFQRSSSLASQPTSVLAVLPWGWELTADGWMLWPAREGAVIDCVFCDIIKGDYPSRIVYEDADTLAFEDINPKAPIHVLIAPKRHLATLCDAGEEDRAILGNLLLAANRIGDQLGVAKRGFRLVLNCNPEGGQVVYHLHMHFLAGRQMGWSPA